MFALAAAGTVMMVMRSAMTTMETTTKLVAVAAFAACAVTPAFSCATRQTPELAWHAIDRTLPRAGLSDGDLVKVRELRAKTFAALDAVKRQVPRTVEAAQYQAAAEAATQRAVGIVGLVWAQPLGGVKSRGCGGTYRLKGALDKDG
jgi:hypothetical protein